MTGNNQEMVRKTNNKATLPGGDSIKGVTLLGDPIYLEGPYGVYVGYIKSDNNKDIPHYLIVNMTHYVVEGSSARMFEARAMCQAFAKELDDQNKMLEHGIDMVERIEDPDGNIDPEFQEKQKKWKAN